MNSEAAENAALQRAIAESLREKCQFCPMVFDNKSDLQFHELDGCVIGKSEVSDGPMTLTTVITDIPKQSVVHDLEDCTDLTEDSDDEVFHDTSEEHISEEHILPISYAVPSTSNRKSAAEHQVAETPRKDVPRYRSSRLKNLPSRYKLNKTLALTKKRKACDRHPMTIKQNKNSTVITLNTATFEFFRRNIQLYLESRMYIISPDTQRDENQLITQNILRVLDRHGVHKFTLNMYTTSSRIMINGPSYTRFTQEDLPAIISEIDKESESLWYVNEKTKERITECLENNIDIHNPTNEKQSGPGDESLKQITKTTIEHNTSTIPAKEQDQIVETTSKTDHSNDNQSMAQNDKPIPAKDGPEANQANHGNIDKTFVTRFIEVIISTSIAHLIEEEQRERDVHNNNKDKHLDYPATTTTTTFVSSTQKCTIPNTASTDIENTENTSTTHVRRSGRISHKTAKSQAHEETTKGKNKSKRKSGEDSRKDTPSWICPKCNKTVTKKQNGVVCEACIAYWHFGCAGTSEEYVRNMPTNEDFFCPEHRLIPSPLEEVAGDTEGESSSQKELEKDPQIEITDKDLSQPHNEERSQRSNQAEDDKANKAEEKRLTKELKRISDEHKQLVDHITQLKKEHQTKLDRNQKTLDSLSNQTLTLKKEKAQFQLNTSKLEKKNHELTEKNDDLEKKVKALMAENDAHTKFVADSLISDPTSADIVQKMKEDIDNLRKTAEEKDEKIIDLQNAIPIVEPKIAAKNKEILSLKTQISALEATLSKMENDLQQHKRDLNVAQADHQREKELNTFFLRNQNREASQNGKIDNIFPMKSSGPQQPPNSQPQHDFCETVFKQGYGSCTPECTKNHKFNFERLNRGVCHLYVKGKCRRNERCWFSHEIPESLKKDDNIIQAAEEFVNKRRTKKHSGENNTKPAHHRSENLPVQHNYCETVFTQGQGSCKPECPKYHDFGFVRLNRGICHLFVKGKCRRRERCWFTHEIPESIKTKSSTVQTAEDFLKKRKDNTGNHSQHQTQTKGTQGKRSKDNDNVAENEAQERTPTPTISNTSTQAEATSPQQQKQAGNSTRRIPIEPMNIQQSDRCTSFNYNSYDNSEQFVPQNIQPPCPEMVPQDPFLLLVKTMIQDQLRQQLVTQTPQLPSYVIQPEPHPHFLPLM